LKINRPYIPFIPITLGGFNVNYFFIIYFVKYKIYAFKNQPTFFYIFLIQATLSLLFSIFFIYPVNGDIHSQIISFFSYISVGFLLILRLPFTINDIFKGLQYITVMYSIYAVCIFLIDPDLNIFNYAYSKIKMREYVPGWPQRYPLMVAISFIYVLSNTNKKLFDIFSLLILGACILITFTRSLYLAIIIPSFIIGFKTYLKSLITFIYKFKIKGSILLIPMMIIGIIYFLTFSENSIQILIENTYLLLKNYILNKDSIMPTKSGSSEGMRIYRWIVSFNIFLQYPLFGTGFRGIYQFTDMGSTHSQYFDVLLRTGITGFIIHVYLFANIMRNYNQKYYYVKYIILCLLIFGIFNESVKQIFTAVFIFLLNNKSVIKNSNKDFIECVES